MASPRTRGNLGIERVDLQYCRLTFLCQGDSMIRAATLTLGVVLMWGCGSESHAPPDVDGGMRPPDGSGLDAPPAEDGGPGPDAPMMTDAGPSGRTTGGPCTRPADCAPTPVAGAPECFPGAFGWPGGYCTNEGCNPSLDNCPGDGVCELGMDGGSVCLDACDPGAPDCRPGYTCFDASVVLGGASRHYCLPLCTDDGDCGPGEVCDNMGTEPSRLCYTAGAGLGDACSDSTDCGRSGLCLAEDPFGFPGGYCSSSCNPMLTGECGGGVCVETDAPDQGLCLLGCTMPTDCRAGYGCNDRMIFFGMLPDSACVPECSSSSDCTLTGRTCESSVGLCQPALAAAEFGGPCTGDGDCVGGFCLTEGENGAAHGYCVDECDPGGTDPADCPAGGTCLDLGPSIAIGVCLTGCDPMSPACRVGYVCPSLGFVTDACVPDCSSSTQCESMCCRAGMGPFATGQCVSPTGMPPPTCLP